MTSGIIDISVSLKRGMAVWPGSIGYNHTQVLDLCLGDQCNVSQIHCDVHVGTHIDAPFHFIKDGATVDKLDLNKFVGTAQVFYLPSIKSINAEVLSALDLAPGMTRLLFRTLNSEYWKRDEAEFQDQFVAFTADGAKWVVEHGIELVGVDYLSVQRFGDPPKTHEILLGAGVAVIEGLNLADVKAGVYELICLPLKIVGSDGAPARAILREIDV